MNQNPMDPEPTETAIVQDDIHTINEKRKDDSAIRTLPRSPPDSSDDEKPKPSSSPSAANDPLAHLPEHQQRILRAQTETKPVKVSPRKLYGYASRTDLIIMAVGAICAIAGGAAMPLMTVVFGSLTGIFQGAIQHTISGDEFSSELSRFTLYFVYLAIGEFCTIYIATVAFIYTGEHVTAKIREAYLAAVLKQNIGYFDKIGAGEITTRITADTNLIQDGVTEKVSLTLVSISSFVAAYIIGYIKGWLLTLILTSSIVVIVFIVSAGSEVIIRWNKTTIEAYAEGGTMAEEVLSSIRNCTAFGTQNKLALQYDVHLKKARYYGLRWKYFGGFMWGICFFAIYMTYALAFWEGSRLLVRGEAGIDLPAVITILLAVMIGSFALGNVSPHLQAFATALAAAGKVFAVIERISPLDPTSQEGLKPEKIEGSIELQDIHMIYPSRPEVKVMDGVSLKIAANKTTALVGASGSGKSTIVGLIERFYDPVEGQVLLDGIPLKDINLRFLREQVSLVGQEPVLFATSIFNNIAHGLIGTKFEHVDKEVKREMVQEAAKQANAFDFISELPEGFETNVGERGFLMSGGQKQRIAIARAIISKPKILLLDEATAALDTKSEGVVQAALDKASVGRTTIVVAHRLSTIKNAHRIIVMSQGRIIESGNHEQLLEKRGAYFGLVKAQTIAAETAAHEEKLKEAELERHKSRTSSMSSEAEKEMLKEAEIVEANELNATHHMEIETKSSFSFWRLIQALATYNKQEWHLMVTGLIGAIITGAGQPVQAVFFSKCIVALARPPSEYAILRHDINFWSWMFFMLAWVVFFSHTTMGVAFAHCSEQLIRRVRDRAFRTMLRQDVGFYDREENSSGALTSYLSTEATSLAGLSGQSLGTILQVTTTMVAAFIVAIAVGWKLALVCTATVPAVLGSGYLRFHMLARFQANANAAYQKSAAYACEATSAIRTVASLCREEDVWRIYHEQLEQQGRDSLKNVLQNAALYASSQALLFCAQALGFWYGGTLIGSGEYSLQQFFICFSTIIFGAQSAGIVFAFAPDMGKAKHAAEELQKLFDRKPAIDTWSTKGEEVEECQGTIEFRNVHFRYPTRPEQRILKGLNLTVKPGQYVALVGASGCGKSTTISLIERFYDPTGGQVLLDGKDISSLNINSYRKHLALVSQEPTLYAGTIRENILLGAAEEGQSISEDRLIKACKEANILTFIESLPDGFSTIVGNKGVMLSGGQKQRIAIARALVRDPKVLLLDEATSALDSESEKVVQAALDQAAKGRTTIAIAHRLSTIQKADRICVFEGGKVVESGSHSELMRKKGKYFELVSMQSLGMAEE